MVVDFVSYDSLGYGIGDQNDFGTSGLGRKTPAGTLVSGRKALEAFQETGSYDRSDWSVKNWTTNGNSYRFKIEHSDEDRFSFCFDIAWSFPVSIFGRLAEIFPTLRFDCACFDEMWTFAGEGAFNGEPPFEFVDATDEIHLTVYGSRPAHYDKSMETGVVMAGLA